MSTAFQVIADDSSPLDAHFQVEDTNVIFHSRGGSKTKNPVNSDYSTGLRLLLRRLAATKLVIEAAWVDSSRVQSIPLAERMILGPKDFKASPEEAFTMMTSRMKSIGRAPGSSENGGNSTKRLRIKLSGSPSQAAIVQALRGVPVSKDFRSLSRLPAEELRKVTPEHIWKAVQKILGGYTEHGFGPSTDYDLLADNGTRLPPKAVFGLAASETLGFKVLPKHFVAGPNAPCFQVLEMAGYKIIPKDETPAAETTPSADDEWSEGSPKWVQHAKRERAPGLSRAKKTQFMRLHGKLFCERCHLDPVMAYGSVHGEACIEVHHHKVQVKDMQEDHSTTLEDLQCLCANCHRVAHKLLKVNDTAS